MKPARKVKRARRLADAGWNNCEISREIGVHRRTVSDWVRRRTRAGSCPGCGRSPTCPRCPGEPEVFRGFTGFAYAYLLGLYLGDGWIATHRRGVHRLRIFLDSAYPLIVAECEAAVSIVMPSSKAVVYRRKGENLDEVGSYSRHWPHLFPQHGRGRKHERPIALERWQQEIVDLHPGRLLRGLIHSDGCRVTNIIHHPKKTYSYRRYFFSNRSNDIQRIFCDACDRLEIAWRQDGPWNISVARREAVAIMDRHVGPKR
jgi:hypothetical protein